MQAILDTPPSNNPLQLLLFVDKRPSSKEQIRKVRSVLKELRQECDFDLQVIDVSEQPYLAEHFRLIATPTLIRVHPEPKQTLAGANLVEQLKHWWVYWQRSVTEYAAQLPYIEPPNLRSLTAISADPILENTSAEPPQLTVSSESEAVVSLSSVQGEGRPEAQRVTQSLNKSAEVFRLSDEVFKLKQEKEELEHQLQFKDQIIAMLAHDLRNPLTATSIALETLEMGFNPKDGSESRLTPTLTVQLLKHARTQTRAIDRMVTDLLQAARGTGTDLRIQPEKIDLAIICTDVVEHLQERFASKMQRIETDIPSDLPKVLVDGERVRQVLINLLDNAIKYSPVGGTIQLSVLHRTLQKLQISVCDNGPGIPSENRDRIFEERFRLKRDEDKDGYGLGLSLCQRIIRAHYGQIWVDSSPSGSCFHFTLPVIRG
jgi:two-component system, OmpR family, clock-associated histidine kinase SasA